MTVALDRFLENFGKAGNAADTAYAVLREAIVTNALAPGARLRADDLAKQLGVSKTPVREALRKLQAEELIAVQPGSGLSVKVLSEKELFDIYFIREALEAWPHGSPRTIAVSATCRTCDMFFLRLTRLTRPAKSTSCVSLPATFSWPCSRPRATNGSIACSSICRNTCGNYRRAH